MLRSPVVECGNRETDGNGEEAAKKDITESKRTINKKKFESNHHYNNHHIKHQYFQRLMINQLTSGSPSPSVLPLAQKTQEEQIWKTRKRQLSVLSLCVICVLLNIDDDGQIMSMAGWRK